MKKLITSTDALRPALKKLGQAVKSKPVTPALSNLYLKASAGLAVLTTSDLELTISYALPCECKDEFEMLIPFDFFSSLIGLLGGQPLTIEFHSTTRGTLIAQDETYTLKSLEKVQDFPASPGVPVKKKIDFDKPMMEWLERAMATVTKDELRPAMTQACLELDAAGMTIVSTDAHTLTRRFFEKPYSDSPESILIGPRVARALQGMETAVFSWRDNHIALVSDRLTVIQTRLDAKFPDYRVVIPNSEPTLEIDRNGLLGALMKSSLVNSRHVDLRFPAGASDRFNISSSNEDLARGGEVTLCCKNTGKTEVISFNTEMLQRILSHIPFDLVRFHIDGPKRGVVITSEEEPNYLGLIMPLYNQ